MLLPLAVSGPRNAILASVERAAETGDSQRHGEEHQSGEPYRLGPQIADGRAFEQDAAHDPDEMGERQALPDPLRPNRHPREWECEPGHHDIRQEEHDRHLHRLQLVPGDRGEGVTDRQVGGDEEGGQYREDCNIAHHRHAEQPDAGAEDQDSLNKSD